MSNKIRIVALVLALLSSFAAFGNASAQTPPTCDPAGSTNGTATPPYVNTDQFTLLVGTGYTPGEAVSFFFTLPNGNVIGTAAPVEGGVAPDGTVGLRLTITPAIATLGAGRWAITYVGATSQRQSVIYFCVNSVPPAQPTAQPTAVPPIATTQPTAQPTTPPTSQPTTQPTAQATAPVTPTTGTPPSTSMVYGVTMDNRLVSFQSSAPATLVNNVAIGGLQSGENVLGIDFRPATGQLFGLGSSNRLYTIDLTSGAATQVGTAVLTTTLSGADFGFDFNPVVDRIRVTSNTGQDLRLNPNNGQVAAVDGTLTYTTTDRNTGATPNIVGSAYSNNIPGPASTTLYDIDSNLDNLVTQNPPNAGVLNTVGSLGVDTTGMVGFDIAGSGTAFASLMLTGTNTSSLYSISLETGAATMVGAIGSNLAIRDISLMLTAAPATVTPAPATPAPATATAVATAPPAETPTSAPTTAPTMLPTEVPPTAVPTMAAPPTMMPLPTGVIPGMPTTGQGDDMSGMLLATTLLVSFGLISVGYLARRKQANTGR